MPEAKRRLRDRRHAIKRGGGGGGV
jgi:hypothetical protein